jgi:hypothetical protein
MRAALEPPTLLTSRLFLSFYTSATAEKICFSRLRGRSIRGLDLGVHYSVCTAVWYLFSSGLGLTNNRRGEGSLPLSFSLNFPNLNLPRLWQLPRDPVVFPLESLIFEYSAHTRPEAEQAREEQPSIVPVFPPFSSLILSLWIGRWFSSLILGVVESWVSFPGRESATTVAAANARPEPEEHEKGND